MAKWEYRVCAVKTEGPGNGEEQTNEALQRFSEEGYRFVETIYPPNRAPLLLFKKTGKLNVKFASEKAQA